ncbi:MAG: aconitate hydratase AcnA, partial [Comamonadaceae bacterium]
RQPIPRHHRHRYRSDGRRDAQARKGGRVLRRILRTGRRGATGHRRRCGNRAFRGRRPCHRSFVGSRPSRLAACAGIQHAGGVRAQRRTLFVPEVGGVRIPDDQGVSAGDRHRASSQPGTPCARRRFIGRRGAFRFAGGHGQPHHHDQRYRRPGLGRRRDRGRGGDAGATDLSADAGGGRGTSCRQPIPRHHRHRYRSDGRRDAQARKGGRVLRRILRTGRRGAAAFFPVDAGTIDYLRTLGRSAHELAMLRAYCEAQDMYGMPALGQIDYSRTIELDLGVVVPSLAGPSRPQDRLSLQSVAAMSAQLFGAPIARRGHGAPDSGLRHGDIVIAAITSCTNTSNPAVMLSAGLVAKKAHALGLRPATHVKTSLTPGSRVVSEYMAAAGLTPALEAMGFHAVGYGCATCMGNSGPLDATVLDQIEKRQLVVAAVLSGNRNFEARIHQAVRSNFLMSPPLVVIFSIVGSLNFDPAFDPVGFDREGSPVFFKDLWPTPEELQAVMPFARDARHVVKIYDAGRPQDPMWTSLKSQSGSLFEWDAASTYIKRPPFFDDFTLDIPQARPIKGARALVVLGDSVTTDHINPGSAIPKHSDAGRYLSGLGVAQADFNSYISRRANDQVMVRSIFAHIRLRNLLVPGSQGSVTVLQPSGEKSTIFEAARAYAAQDVATLVFAGEEYGTGSSRDWAAKGTRLLGIRAVIAMSFERIHRSNLIGMGVLPCEFLPGQSVATLGLDGTETFDLVGAQTDLEPGKSLSLHIHRTDGSTDTVELKLRIDTVIEQRYYEHGGILPFVLRDRLTRA